MAKASESSTSGRVQSAVGGELGEAGGDVDRREPLGGAPDVGFARQNEAGELGENRLLAAQRLIGGGGDLDLQLGEIGGRKAHRVGHRLAMDEGRVERRPQQLLALRLRNLEKIAEEIIVLQV